MEYVGIDLHKKESQICLLTETGEVIERRIRTEPPRFAEVLGGRRRPGSGPPCRRDSGGGSLGSFRGCLVPSAKAGVPSRSYRVGLMGAERRALSGTGSACATCRRCGARGHTSVSHTPSPA
jgi:hypothetical protein